MLGTSNCLVIYKNLSKNQFFLSLMYNIKLIATSCYFSPVAWQITLRSVENKKEPGGSEEDADEDLCILIFGSVITSDKAVKFRFSFRYLLTLPRMIFGFLV